MWTVGSEKDFEWGPDIHYRNRPLKLYYPSLTSTLDGKSLILTGKIWVGQKLRLSDTFLLTICLPQLFSRNLSRYSLSPVQFVSRTICLLTTSLPTVCLQYNLSPAQVVSRGRQTVWERSCWEKNCHHWQLTGLKGSSTRAGTTGRTDLQPIGSSAADCQTLTWHQFKLQFTACYIQAFYDTIWTVCLVKQIASDKAIWEMNIEFQTIPLKCSLNTLVSIVGSV